MNQCLSRSQCAIALVLFLAGSAHAQYKWIGPEGTINYGDRMPPAGVRVLANPPSLTPTAGFGGAALPYALRTATQRFPVTLYTTPRCEPCDQGRAQLNKRGIPFTESVVDRPAEVAALRKLGASGTILPVLRVGRENVDGFEPGAWDRLLDGGGYPRSSMLPYGYRQSPTLALAANSGPRGGGKSDASEGLASADEEAEFNDGKSQAAKPDLSGLPVALPMVPRTEPPASRSGFRF